LNGIGVVYSYEKTQSGEWVQASRLVALDSADGDFFGSYLKISDSVLAVGADGVTSPQVFDFSYVSYWFPFLALYPCFQCFRLIGLGRSTFLNYKMVYGLNVRSLCPPRTY
jgi:hypothetical protein